MEQSINGFTPQEVFLLYAFVESYETAGIKSYKTQTSLFKEHPELKELTLVLNKAKCHYSNSEEMKSIDIKTMNNEIYYTEYQIGHLLSLLYHLRNSIDHACAIKHGTKTLITDFKVKRPTEFSARGRISLDIINEFTHILKKIHL